MLRAAVAAMLLLPLSKAQERSVAAAEPTVTLEGCVVDLRGEPVPMAAVKVVTWDERDVVLAESMCDGEGCFRIARVPQRSSWLVQVRSPGRCLGEGSVSGDPRPLRIKVHDAANVKGVLRRRDGTPVVGATVRAELVARILFNTRVDATTDEAGRFELTGVPLGLVRFAAVVPDQGLAELRALITEDRDVAIAPASEPTTSLQIVIKGLPEGAAKAVSASILPYAAGRLSRLPPPWDRPVFDDRGRFGLSSVPDIQYRVSPSAAGFAFAPRELRAEPGKGPHLLQFTASRIGGAALQCPARVRDAEGKPVAGLRLLMRASNGGKTAEAISGEDGTLTFGSPLAAGSKVVVFSLDDRWVLDQEKTEEMYGIRDRRFLIDHECTVDPATTLDLRAAPACGVEGRVLLADGRPAAFVDVEVEEENGNRMPRWMTFTYATTDRDGRYSRQRQHHLQEAVRVKVEGPDGSAVSEPFALAQPGARAKVPDLKLAPPAIVAGTVVDARQQPAPGIRVWLRDWDFAANGQKSGSVVEVITDRAGRYRFVGVPPGGAWLQLLVEDEHPRDRAVEPFEVEAGKRYTQDLQLPAK